ncbi:hypothetical protein MOE41_17715 [Bacillus atrophaeus]|nr:hypothetical protein [Bacillus atrophaeus]
MIAYLYFYLLLSLALPHIHRLKYQGKSHLKNKLWLIVGSVIMGFGIWAMHFIGMMAFHTQYEMIPLAPSVTAAISGSFVSLYIVFDILPPFVPIRL